LHKAHRVVRCALQKDRYDTGAGIVTVFLQRAADDPMGFMQVQDKARVFFWMREFAGVGFFIGLLVYLRSFFIVGEYEYASEVKQALAA